MYYLDKNHSISFIAETFAWLMVIVQTTGSVSFCLKLCYVQVWAPLYIDQKFIISSVKQICYKSQSLFWSSRIHQSLQVVHYLTQSKESVINYSSHHLWETSNKLHVSVFYDMQIVIFYSCEDFFGNFYFYSLKKLLQSTLVGSTFYSCCIVESQNLHEINQTCYLMICHLSFYCY